MAFLKNLKFHVVDGLCVRNSYSVYDKWVLEEDVIEEWEKYQEKLKVIKNDIESNLQKHSNVYTASSVLVERELSKILNQIDALLQEDSK